jgi:hypothetical protein
MPHTGAANVFGGLDKKSSDIAWMSVPAGISREILHCLLQKRAAARGPDRISRKRKGVVRVLCVNGQLPTSATSPCWNHQLINVLSARSTTSASGAQL